METDRISQENFAHGENSGLGSLNYSMLIEDFAISRYRLKDNKLSIKLTGVKAEEIKMDLSNLLRFDQYGLDMHSEKFEQIIMYTIESTSNHIVNNGHCIFEKIYKKSKRENKRLVSLRPISGKTLISRKYVTQIFTNEDNKIIKLKIPITKCYIVEFPIIICSEKKYLNTLKRIKGIDKRNPLKSIFDTNFDSKSSYDVWEHRRVLDLKLWEITKDISWHHRSQYSNKEMFSNYFLSLVDMEFKRNKILLLEHILKFIESIINDLFKNIEVNISYQKNHTDIEKEIEDFKRGNFNQDRYIKIIKDYF